MSARPLSFAVLVVTALTLLVVALEVGTPVQPVVVGIFLLLVPGAAVILGLSTPSVAAWITAAVSASIALDILVATALLYAGWWTPVRVLVVLSAVCVTCSTAALLRTRRVGASS